MKHLQSFNERKFYTVKYNNQEITINDIEKGEWSLTDHLNPKIDKLANSLNDLKSRINSKGSKVYVDEAEKIDQMCQILDNIKPGTEEITTMGSVEPIYNENDSNLIDAIGFIRGAIVKYADYSSLDKNQLIDYISSQINK